MITLTAVLFAGGLSTRMGKDKALVEIGGEALWARQLRLLSQLEPKQIFLSCRENPSWSPSTVQPILDEEPSSGPLSGLTPALKNLETTHLLALAVDLPRMHIDLLRRLRDAAEPCCGVVPVISDRFEPLCAIYPREAAPIARHALERGELSLQKFIRTLVSEQMIAPWRVSEADRNAFFNANTPADLGQL